MNRQDREILASSIALIMAIIMWFVISGCCTISKARHDSVNAMKEGYIEGYIDGIQEFDNKIIEQEEDEKLHGI